jgi:hypothetical protein
MNTDYFQVLCRFVCNITFPRIDFLRRGLKAVCDELSFERQKDLLIGEGSARRVYGMKKNKELVIKELKTKEQIDSKDNSNKQEWEVWNKIRNWQRDSALFGKCERISDSGRYLVMERLNDLTATDKIPSTPVWLTDRKRENFGKTQDGQIKVRDYGQLDISKVRENSPCHPLLSQEQSARTKALIVKLRELESPE